MAKRQPFSLKRDFYTLASSDGINAEMTLYGDIVEVRPVDWWTGEEIPGDFIVQDEFLKDLDAVKNCSALNIKINSAGGDAAVSVLIHNRLREMAAKGMRISCVVDGVAMSGGSLIMCACDNVQVYPSSIVMIHKCWTFLLGGYNADELRNAAVQQDAIDRAQVGIYARKTGLSETQLLHMMGDTTYMTGKDAVAKGFADEMLDGDVTIAASADGRSLFVHGREMRLYNGIFAPDFVPTSGKEEEGSPKAGTGEEADPEEETDISGDSPEDIEKEAETAANEPGEPGNEGGVEFMTLEEFREQNPEEARRIDEAQAAAVLEAENRARAAERERLQGIDQIAVTVGDADLVNEARWGETACDARELAFRAMQKSAKAGAGFMTALANDAKASGAADVNPVPPAPDTTAVPQTAEEKMNAASAEIKSILHPEHQASAFGGAVNTASGGSQ